MALADTSSLGRTRPVFVASGVFWCPVSNVRWVGICGFIDFLRYMSALAHRMCGLKCFGAMSLLFHLSDTISGTIFLSRPSQGFHSDSDFSAPQKSDSKSQGHLVSIRFGFPLRNPPRPKPGGIPNDEPPGGRPFFAGDPGLRGPP